MFNWKAAIALTMTAVLLVGAIWLPAAAQSDSLSGSLTTGTTGTTALSLTPVGQTESLYSQRVRDGSYSFSNVLPGTYTLKAENSRRATRTYEVTISEDGTASQDIKLCAYGDVNLDGKINVVDTARIYAYVRKTGQITDAYALICADYNQDGRINVGDTAKIYTLVRNPVPEETDPTEPPEWTVPSDPFDVTTPMDPFDPTEPEKEYPVPSNPVVDNADEPIEVGGTLSFEASVQAGHLVHYNLFRISGTFLVIEDPNVYVIYDGKTYTPENGVVTVPDLYTNSSQTPVKLAIGNKGVTDKVYAVTLAYPQGHQMNPYDLANGNLTTFCEEGNSQGVYYSFTAETSGTLTVRIKSVSGAKSCNLTLTNDNLIGGTLSESTEDNGTSSVSMTMNAGETVILNVVVNPENGFNYPEATVNTVVRFR